MDTKSMDSEDNEVRLLLLLDQSGSMTPFHVFSRQLVDLAKQREWLFRSSVYYFHNVPFNYLYKDLPRLHGVCLTKALSSLPSGTVALIFSDAGAARQSYQVERILRTERFLHHLEQHVSRIVWLNPLPKDRWLNSSAEQIAYFLPMFEMSQLIVDIVINTFNENGLS